MGGDGHCGRKAEKVIAAEICLDAWAQIKGEVKMHRTSSIIILGGSICKVEAVLEALYIILCMLWWLKVLRAEIILVRRNLFIRMHGHKLKEK